MLAALVLLGLLPLAALPMTESAGSAPSGPAPDEPDPDDQILPEAPPLVDLDMLVPQTDDGAADDPGEAYTLDPAPGTTVLTAFSPGEDSVQIDLTGQSGPVTAEFNMTDDGPSVSFLIVPEDPTTVLFENLGAPPTDDIMLRLIDTATGAPFETSLADAIAAGEVYTVIDPVDPDSPDDPGGDDGDGTVIDPIDPDTPDEPADEVDETTVIDPLDPGAEELGALADLPLNEHILRDSENTFGRSGALSDAAQSGIADTALTTGDDDFSAAPSSATTTGLEMSQTVPALSSDSAIDVIDGGQGDDRITTGDAAAFAFGGEGDDTLIAGEAPAALYGGAGADALQAGAAGSYLDGGIGDDLIAGGAGDDILEGGEHWAGESAGNDTLLGGDGNDEIRGGYGADSLEGGAGDDVIDHLGRTEERMILPRHEFAWHVSADADTLDGGSGDDTLIFDRNDTASGGSGADVFRVYHDGSASNGAAEVTDFEIGTDILHVMLNPQMGQTGTPEVSVSPSPDGQDGHVMVNGDLVAILRGAPSATTSDVTAEMRPDLLP